MIHELLRGVVLFESLDDEGLRTLVALGQDRRVGEGEILYQQGDGGDTLFVLLDGSVVLYRDALGHAVQLLDRLGGGDTFGESVLFGEGRRTESAKAEEEGRVLVFGRDAFRRVMAGRPAFALRLQIAAAQRHGRYAAAALDLGQQSEARIRLDVPAELTVRGEVRRPVSIQNLSTGGVSLAGVPGNWEVGQEVRLDLTAGEERLVVRARVSWVEADRAGLAFLERTAQLERRVYRLLRRVGS